MDRRNEKPALLIVDDEVSFRESLVLAFEDAFSVSVADGLASAREKLRDRMHDVVLLDIRLPDGDGVELLADLKSSRRMPIVFAMTAHATVESAVKALKEGAANYIVKPFDIAKLKRELAVYLENRSLQSRVDSLDREFSKLAPPFVTTGAGTMKEVVERTTQIAPLDIPILIRGETGTGKEKLAAWIHTLSGRKGEMVAINCATLPKDILESELFGYVKGAFSGAVAVKEGLVERADGGTLFLDEVGELPETVQAKFLRVLEDGIYYKLGDTRERRVNIRLISASNRDLADSGTAFRRDLYFRLNGLTLELPPLRERREDIPLLISALIKDANFAYKKEIKGVSPQVLQHFSNYDWPGNIRELKWCITRAVAMAASERLELSDVLFEKAQEEISFPEKDMDFSIPFTTAMDNLEKHYIAHALEIAGDNKTEAAKVLGISVRSLHYKLKLHQM